MGYFSRALTIPATNALAHYTLRVVLYKGTVHFKNVNNCLYTNVYSYLETLGGISYHPYLNVVHFFNTRVN